MEIRPYLTFKGECQEAIELYQDAFDIKTPEIMRFGDMPPNPDMEIPESMNKWVLQAALPFGDNFIRLSDTFGDFNDAPSERVSVVFEGSKEEVEKAFQVLSQDGTVQMPLEATFFSPAYGTLVDKFGIKWNFAASEE
ncbi:MAG: VOC family protein [Methanobacterium sp.]|nr:VOC family protein [Methanobacterium sp.]